MKPNKIKYVDLILSSPGLDKKTITDEYFSKYDYINPHTHIYTVKEGYSLPVTGYKMVPNRFFGYSQYKVDCTLPENSTFMCNDRSCKHIISNDTPIINSEKYIGKCYGEDCVENDWSFFNAKEFTL